MPVLDTSFLIDLRNGQPTALAALEQLAGQQLVVPVAAAKEFIVALDEPLGAWRLLQHDYTIAFERMEHAVVASRLVRRLRAARRKVTWNDANIAAQAVLDATFVVTADVKDFTSMGCTVWDYRKDPKPPA